MNWKWLCRIGIHKWRQTGLLPGGRWGKECRRCFKFKPAASITPIPWVYPPAGCPLNKKTRTITLEVK